MKPICETCHKSITLERFQGAALCERCERIVARRLAPAERELAEARAALMTDTLPMPAEDYPIARRLREERDHYRGLVDASDTTRREWEVRAATSYADGRKAGLREAAAKLAELRDEWEVSDE